MANVFVVLMRWDDWRSSEGEVADKAAMIGGGGREGGIRGETLHCTGDNKPLHWGYYQLQGINHIPIYNSIPSPKMKNNFF